MDPYLAIMQVLITGVIELLMLPVIAFVFKRMIGKKLDIFDERREMARVEREEDMRRREKWQDAVTSGLRSMLRAELIAEHRKAVAQNYCDLETREYVERTYHSYHGLNGNGIGTRLFEEIMALPSKPGQP